MENHEHDFADELPKQGVFALDIGTRSIIGMVGILDEDRIQIVAIEKAEHAKRAMIDGQIEDIDQVAKVAGIVKDRLEKKLGCKLTRVAVAAAGRALRTESASYEMMLPEVQKIDAETVSRLEAGAIGEAEKAFRGEEGEGQERRFYLVGYSVSRYYLDNYTISSLLDHHGQALRADIIATFLPSEVVESLYAAMRKIGLEVASLTLEPIAAINAAIPPGIRLLNLAMVDIGAGTSDIAVCRDGSVTGYTMAIQAGDEITESVMKECLVDFQTAEKIKSRLNDSEQIEYTDIMGYEQTVTRERLLEIIKDASRDLCEEICSKIIEVNGGVPSAVYLAGGGSQLLGLKEGITERLQIDSKRVAIAGRNFKVNAYSEDYDLENPEYATPLGIAISAGLNMINDSFRLILNGEPAKLFRSGTFTVMDILMMNGFGYQDMMGKSGQNLVVSFNGGRKVFYGEKAEPCVLRLNGEETQLSRLVRAGDKIDFIPARHGENAQAMLSQLVALEEGRSVTVNGEPVQSDVALKSGDVILVEGMYEVPAPAPEEDSTLDQEPELKEEEKPKAPAAKRKRRQASTAASGKKKAIGSATEKKKASSASSEKKRSPSVSALRKKKALEAPEEEGKTIEQEAPETLEPAQEEPQEMAAESPVSKVNRGITIYFNGRRMLLPPKPDGMPYYLMDMLQYSDLDFEKVTAPVILEINGESGAFQQELRDEDQIRIFEQPMVR